MGRRNDRVAVLSTEGAIKKLVELAQAVGRQEVCMHLTTIDAELLQKCAGGSIRDWLEWQSSDLQ